MSEPIKRNYMDPDQTIWLDPDGETLHLDAPKVCKVLGIPATRENQDMVEREAFNVMAQLAPGLHVETRYDLL